MKYLYYDVVFQEIPDELSIAFLITNCPRCCDGCHSPQLQEDIGKRLDGEELKRIIELNMVDDKPLFSCILFMGGEQYHDILLSHLIYCESLKIKTALYTGADDVDDEIKQHLNYLKVGAYKKELGGLESPTTNQKLIKLK